jgi:hypothetical protein
MSANLLSREGGGRTAIKYYLCHRASRECFKDGAWSGDTREASIFSDVLEAAEICARCDLTRRWAISSARRRADLVGTGRAQR